MPSMQELSSYKTTIATNALGQMVITYTSTAIVTFDQDSITLDSGGWQTVTTKRKMCQASNQFDLGYMVFQKAHKWFVTLPSGEKVPFADGMTFPRK